MKIVPIELDIRVKTGIKSWTGASQSFAYFVAGKEVTLKEFMKATEDQAAAKLILLAKNKETGLDLNL